jgi:hypothetical protein
MGKTMAKLDIELIAVDEQPLDLLAKLAKAKFNADDVHVLPGTNTLDIDKGINDIRGLIDGNRILFYYRYKKDCSRYEASILDYCRANNLTLRFNASEK